MKERRIPMRSCVVTKEKFPKRDLIRIVRTPEGQILIDDEKGKTSGRGAYLKKDVEVIETAQKNKVLERHLEMKIDNKVYNDLKSRIKK